jgi:hypothetical protein
MCVYGYKKLSFSVIFSVHCISSPLISFSTLVWVYVVRAFNYSWVLTDELMGGKFHTLDFKTWLNSGYTIGYKFLVMQVPQVTFKRSFKLVNAIPNLISCVWSTMYHLLSQRITQQTQRHLSARFLSLNHIYPVIQLHKLRNYGMCLGYGIEMLHIFVSIAHYLFLKKVICLWKFSWIGSW